MTALRDFVADLMERRGAAVETIEPHGLAVMAPPDVRAALGWPELARLGFGADPPPGLQRIGVEGEWLERFDALIADRGRYGARQIDCDPPPALTDPERLLDRVLDLPNAVWRFRSQRPAWTRFLLIAFRMTAVSDEKRENNLWIGFNVGTGAPLDGEALQRLRASFGDRAWRAAEPAVREAAGPGWDAATLEDRVRAALEPTAQAELAPFLRSMQRRLMRDHARLHGYHDDLRKEFLLRLAALEGAQGSKAEPDRQRERQRIAAIEREYQSKLGDLRHKYALRVALVWTQTLRAVRPGAAARGSDPPSKGRARHCDRLAPGRPLGRAAFMRMGARLKRDAPGLRRPAASHGARRPGSVSGLQQTVLPSMLPGEMSAMRQGGE